MRHLSSIGLIPSKASSVSLERQRKWWMKKILQRSKMSLSLLHKLRKRNCKQVEKSKNNWRCISSSRKRLSCKPNCWKSSKWIQNSPASSLSSKFKSRTNSWIQTLLQANGRSCTKSAKENTRFPKTSQLMQKWWRKTQLCSPVTIRKPLLESSSSTWKWIRSKTNSLKITLQWCQLSEKQLEIIMWTKNTRSFYTVRRSAAIVPAMTESGDKRHIFRSLESKIASAMRTRTRQCTSSLQKERPLKCYSTRNLKLVWERGRAV